MPHAAWTDFKVEQIVGRLLITGVLLSAVIVAFGGILFLVHHGDAAPQYHLFQGEPESLRNLGAILTGALHLESRAVIQLGLLLLIATPVARVIFSVFAFALERDHTYVAITLIVLAVLIYSLSGVGS
ncbi:MAG TPA: DUF1634 domain-containing protein [Candidatus Acidoferrales bacterium]|nr:DUF1634 domain-containing protein [Candidatus Acidoferrales bacterium]